VKCLSCTSVVAPAVFARGPSARRRRPVKESGWTQAEAAGQCGVTQPRINDLLRGCVSRFSIDALVNIATAIGRTVRFDLQSG
jgi:predicted XRE-type DNA-binding protein